MLLGVLGSVETIWASGAGHDIRKGVGPFTWANLADFVKRGLYAVASLEFGREDLKYLLDNFTNLILMNPDPRSSEVRNPMSIFIKIIQPLYVMGIGVTAFYLLLISGTPGGRAKAKSLIMSLTIGMVVISLSPLIIETAVGVSTQTTTAILNTVDVDIVTESIDKTFGGPSYIPTCPLCMAHAFLTWVEIELGYFSFLPFLLVVWGTLIFLIIRFMAVTLFIILFPLAVFLYSFGITRDLGRNILEQFILWLLLQEFNATVVVAIALCLIQKPAGFMAVPLELPTMQGIAGMPSDPGIQIGMAVLFDFIPFMGCLVLALAPLLMLRLFRNFLP
jgi:hypothetical protein